MQLFCSKCQSAYAAASHCPRCGSRLLSPQESFLATSHSKQAPDDRMTPSFGNRFATGLVIAFGTALGLREFGLAFELLPPNSSPMGSNANPATFAIRLFAVLVGSLIAGAARPQGMQVGASIGLAVGGLFAAFDAYGAGSVSHFTGMLLTMIYPLIGAVAGAVGAWLWPADVELPEPTRISSRGSSLARLAAEEADRHIHRPTRWIQIALGSIIVIAGIITSDPMRFALAKYSGGILNTAGVNRSALIGLELGTLLVILGGLVAGAGSGAGFRHGFFAAVITSAGLLISSRNQPNGLFPAVEGFLNFTGQDLEPLLSPRVAINFLLALISLMSLSGALAGQLFPPSASKIHRTRSLQQQS